MPSSQSSSKASKDQALTAAQRQQFLRDGFVKLENAFPAETAAAARKILWPATDCNPDDKATWIHPVVRLGDFPQQPFQAAANTSALHTAFDELVGPGRWVPRNSLGGFVVRFPHPDDPGDTGWHIDASLPPPPRRSQHENSVARLPHPARISQGENDAAESESCEVPEAVEKPVSYFDWRVNLRSDGRALLMLFLFSDVSEHDAPTRIRLGSHLPVARLLAPAADDGMTMLELSQQADAATRGLPETSAAGPAGTVYLCHPFLLHAGQAHHGTAPRFMAQPPLIPRTRFELERQDGDYSLVEKAIRLGLGKLG